MPARDANRGRGGGRGQSGGRTGGGGRDTSARQSAAGQSRGAGSGAGGRGGQSQTGSGRSSGGTQRGGGASASAQRGGGASASGAPQRGASSTQGGGSRVGGAAGGRSGGATATSGRAGSQASGAGSTRPDVAGAQGSSTAGRASSTASARVADVGRRDMELGDVGAATASTTGSSGQGAERQLDIDTAREGDTARAGSAGIGGTRGSGGLSGQVRSSGGAQPGAAVGGRGQGRQGVSPWFAGSENPLTMMRRMQEDLDRVFQAFGIPRFAAAIAPSRELEELLARSPSLTQAAEWSPQIEVFERDNNLVVRADLPGVKREDVEVNVEHDVLTIRGQRRSEHREAEGGYRRTERSYGTFFRQIPLPDGVDPAEIEASYEDGVLEVTVPTPREQAVGRRRIEIR